jgi:threonine/homoserine/homoserine lactone efflux protein
VDGRLNKRCKVKDFLVKLAEQTALVLIILGATLVISGVSGNIEVMGTPWLKLPPSGEIAAVIIGICFIGFGVYLIVNDRLQRKKQGSSSE